MSDSDSCAEEIIDILRSNTIFKIIPICERTPSISSIEQSLRSSARTETEFEMQESQLNCCFKALKITDELTQFNNSLKHLEDNGKNIITNCKSLSTLDLIRPRRAVSSMQTVPKVAKSLNIKQVKEVNVEACIGKCIILFLALCSIFMNMYFQSIASSK